MAEQQYPPPPAYSPEKFPPGAYPPPEQAGYPPQQAGFAPPQAGYAAPPQAGYAPPPQAGYAPPPQAGYAPPPQHAGYNQPPQGYAPPAQGYGYAPQPQMMQQSSNVVVVGGQAPTQTVIVQRPGVNHALHCIITFFFFPWVIVWIILCIAE